MGLGLGLSRGNDDNTVYQTVKAPNPDPFKFKIIHLEQVGTYVVAEIKYDGCTTYEGRKILVLSKSKIQDVRRLTHLDPHFMESNKVEARFRPTVKGWEDAIAYAETKR